MSETVVASDPVKVGPDLFNIVLNLAGSYTLYLDIGGTSKKVVRLSSATHCIVVRRASTPTVDLDWRIKVAPNYFKHGQQFTIYCVVPTPTLASELTS